MGTGIENVRSPDTGGGLEHLHVLTEKVRLFEGLTLRELAWILRRAETKTVTTGFPLVDASDTTESMFIILSGEIAIMSEIDQGMEELTRLGPGTTVGEMTLIDHLPRSANAVTRSETNVLEFKSNWLEGCPSELGQKIFKNLSSILVDRLRKTNELVLSLKELPRSQTEWSSKLLSLGITGWDLSGIEAKHARLSNADLRGVDLRGADFSGADMRGAIFDGADLSNTDLSRAVNAVGPKDDDYWQRLKDNVNEQREETEKALKPKTRSRS